MSVRAGSTMNMRSAMNTTTESPSCLACRLKRPIRRSNESSVSGVLIRAIPTMMLCRQWPKSARPTKPLFQVEAGIPRAGRAGRYSEGRCVARAAVKWPWRQVSGPRGRGYRGHQANPLGYAIRVDDVRMASLKKFPYGLYFHVEDEGSTVIADFPAKY